MSGFLHKTATIEISVEVATPPVLAPDIDSWEMMRRTLTHGRKQPREEEGLNLPSPLTTTTTTTFKRRC